MKSTKNKKQASKSKRATSSQGAKSAKDKGKNAKEFPGYPKYPANEDIMNKATNAERVDVNLENAGNNIQAPKTSAIPDESTQDTGGIDIEQGNESDVTEEDLQALGPKDLSMDMGEDEQLKNRVWPVDFQGGDLDVPGSEDDDAREEVGAEDEENNPYSLGGDNHEDLEEDHS